MTTQQRAAKKAWETIRARKTFRKKYGRTAYNVIARLLGLPQVYDPDCTTILTEAAYKANFNRPGKFRAMAMACKSRAKK